MKVWEYVKSKMQKHLQQKICENTASMTYEEIIVFAQQFSQKLKGIRCCAILCQSEMAASMVLLSCFAAGVTALPLSERYGILHCQKILDAISPDAVVTDLSGKLEIWTIPDALYQEPEIHPALIMCTSGTSGTPKGVMLTETNILTNISDIASYFEMDSTDTILIARPLYHCAVLTGEFLTALIKGANIRFYSGEFNPALILKLVKQYGITTFCGTPTLLAIMAHFTKGLDKNILKRICISGECMDSQTGAKIAQTFPRADIYHVYGLTEACPRISYLPAHSFKKYPDCVGVPLPSVALRIITADGRPAQTNEIGMLWVKGNNVMAGYYNNPEKTSEMLKNGWLCTGDLALFNEAGLLKIKGRSDDLIIKAGMNIYPQEIESALKADPRVKEVCAHGANDERGHVYIVIDLVGEFADVSQVKKLCRQRLPAYQMPAKINLVNEIPKNGSGKTLRRKYDVGI